MIPAELNPRAQTASNRTSLDRYPELFKAAATALPKARRVLSYGCSTGEECATLRSYFPNADILGADINRVNLALARRRFNRPQIQFVHSDDRRLTQLAPFDAIFCMAVLRIRYPHQSRAIAKYPFARFERQVAFLDDLLRVGGLLVLQSTTYRFCDTAPAPRYEVIAATDDSERERPTLLPGGDVAGIYREKVFRKLFVKRAE
jgi:Methyltransferase domain